MALVPHGTMIKEAMVGLANVTTPAEARINTQILSNAGREMQEAIGESDYSVYLADMQVYDDGTYLVFKDQSFATLNTTERKLRNLLYAEAYFGLYHLAISLKKLVKGAVNVNREVAGSASINVSPFDEIIANADNYRDQAAQCIAYATSSDDDPDDIYSEGSFAVFVV